MEEKTLHYIWQNKLYDGKNLKTTKGEIIEIIDPGLLNTDEGPDFFNAKIKIDDTLWAGNVEIHIKASDWFRHKHEKHIGYNNVILHVVIENDTEIYRKNGEQIAQLVLPIRPEIIQKQSQKTNSSQWIACGNKIKSIDTLTWQMWLDRCLIERMESKTERILSILKQKTDSWDEAFYILLARSFGFNLNNDSFEQMARNLPFSILLKHRNNLFQLEALLLGQAGLLSDVKSQNDYPIKLAEEYHFLQKKYNLPTPNQSCKQLRLRPQNNPHLRLAQLAALIQKEERLFSKIIQLKEKTSIFPLFENIKLSPFWETHYNFISSSNKKNKSLGKSSIESLIINVVVPLLFLYAQHTDNDELRDIAMNLIQSIKAEKNSIVDGFAKLGKTAQNAADSQAMIHLKKQYCERKDCIRCRFNK